MKGYEKDETQRFWIDLLHTVFGIDNPTKIMEFELPVKTITKEKGSDFIDCYICPLDDIAVIVAIIFRFLRKVWISYFSAK